MSGPNSARERLREELLKENEIRFCFRADFLPKAVWIAAANGRQRLDLLVQPHGVLANNRE
jgi:hypothetical protein